MRNVQFSFQKAPVTFDGGNVDVRDNGRFKLHVDRLEVLNLRLDEDLRRYMPPVMANFSRRLDDLKISKMKTNLDLGWSGKAGESAWCRWDEALVILENNKVAIGTDFGLEHIEGQIDHVYGSFDGRDLDLHAKLDLDSVDVFNQQVTDLTAALDVEGNLARLADIKGKVLGGALDGHLTADAGGLAQLLGPARGQACRPPRIRHGPAGPPELPGAARRPVRPERPGVRPPLDHRRRHGPDRRRGPRHLARRPPRLQPADAGPGLAEGDQGRLRLRRGDVPGQDGETTLDPVRLIGNAFSLDGRGKVDVRGELDLRLRPLPGRDSLQIP